MKFYSALIILLIPILGWSQSSTILKKGSWTSKNFQSLIIVNDSVLAIEKGELLIASDLEDCIVAGVYSKSTCEERFKHNHENLHFEFQYFDYVIIKDSILYLKDWQRNEFYVSFKSDSNLLTMDFSEAMDINPSGKISGNSEVTYHLKTDESIPIVDFDSVVYSSRNGVLTILENGQYQLKGLNNLSVIKEGVLSDSLLRVLKRKVQFGLPPKGSYSFRKTSKIESVSIAVHTFNGVVLQKGASGSPYTSYQLRAVLQVIEHEVLKWMIPTNYGYLDIEDKNVLFWYINDERTLDNLPLLHQLGDVLISYKFYVIPQNPKYLKCKYDYVLYLPEVPDLLFDDNGMFINPWEYTEVVDVTDKSFVKSLLKDISKWSCDRNLK